MVDFFEQVDLCESLFIIISDRKRSYLCLHIISSLLFFSSFIMSSIAHIDSNDEPLATTKYPILVIYSREANGTVAGAYYIHSLRVIGDVSGNTLAEMRARCFESLEDWAIDEDNVPFDVKNLKESVVFDFVECSNDDEDELALDMQYAGKIFEEIVEAIRK
jgi:hypothetical protein